MSFVSEEGDDVVINPTRGPRLGVAGLVVLALGIAAVAPINAVIYAPFLEPVSIYAPLVFAAIALLFALVVAWGAGLRGTVKLTVDRRRDVLRFAGRQVPLSHAGPVMIWRTRIVHAGANSVGTETTEAFGIGVVIAGHRVAQRLSEGGEQSEEDPYRESQDGHSGLEIDGDEAELVVLARVLSSRGGLWAEAKRVAECWGGEVIDIGVTRQRAVPSLSGRTIILRRGRG